jgi:hypothetical protein
MKKILSISMLIAFMACENEPQQADLIQDSEILSALNVKYGLQKVDESYRIDLLKQSVLLNKYITEIDKAQVTVFKFSDSGKLITIGFRQHKKLLGVWISDSNSSSPVIVNEQLIDASNYSFETQSGSITFESEDQSRDISIARGIVIVNDAPSKTNEVLVKDCEGRHGGEGFCQREGGESFSTCYKAESDEFCDGFVGCISMISPLVQLVIASSCSCASQGCPA